MRYNGPVQLQGMDPLALLTGELQNFQDIFRNILPLPGEIPTLQGIDVHGISMPLTGVIGGDHIIYVDFKKRYDLQARIAQAAAAGKLDVVGNLQRCRGMAGIVLLDVSGHHATDALIAAMLHQAFLLGSLYELEMSGHITKRLFENLNTRFYHSSSLDKFVTMIYGEISETRHSVFSPRRIRLRSCFPTNTIDSWRSVPTYVRLFLRSAHCRPTT